MCLDAYKRLTRLSSMLKYSLADDGYGNNVFVRTSSWNTAYYFVNGELL